MRIDVDIVSYLAIYWARKKGGRKKASLCSTLGEVSSPWFLFPERRSLADKIASGQLFQSDKNVAFLFVRGPGCRVQCWSDLGKRRGRGCVR